MNRYGTALVSTSRWIASGDRYASASFDRLLTGAALAAFLVTAASFLARTSWLLELITHFRFQMALASTVLLVCALARRRLVVAVLAGLAASANAAPLVPYALAGTAEAAAAARPIRVMAANVHYRNLDYAALLEQVREQDPDVLGLMEVDQAWLDEISALESEFRWTLLRPEAGAYGLALYSKLPFRPLPESPYIEEGLQTAIGVELEMEQAPVTLVLAHVRAPTTPGRAELRNVQFERLAKMLQSDDNDAKILVGDLNTTPWSPYYRQLASAAGLSNAALGHGYLPTWPAGFSLLKIPIDHCLVSDALRVVDFRTGEDFGSDHLAIVIDLAIAEESA
ncbi:MAG TPA: endonuclease/exonuclease/phosphatase family protein, partial [Woeseiaceae bacterium]|nr:endonuclease/exonuclease/phosphatase family protein [Woeseiaceae bacterium]